jgi:hypothetical protein
MGPFVNTRLTTTLAAVAATAITGLGVLLLALGLR